MKNCTENCTINDIKQATYILNYFVIYLRHGLKNLIDNIRYDSNGSTPAPCSFLIDTFYNEYGK